ncbi:MAG: XisI protein [Acidobacteria bacterium]|nr:XisI protein [Acidobacteriota bacterium]
MEKMTRYRQLIRQLFNSYAQATVQYPREGVERVLIMNEERGHYQLMTLGWHDQKRVKWLTLYVRCKDGKIWIEHDAIESGFANELIDAGVPATDIVLAFHAPESRELVKLAAA